MKIAIPGYEQLTVGKARALALAGCAPELRAILEQQSLAEYAAARPDARLLRGRGPVHAVELSPECGRVVVRHARRGGLVAAFVADLFLSRLRPLRELIVSFKLRMLGVPNPELVAYVVYPAGILFRYDVATREIEHAVDLADALARTRDQPTRELMLKATVVLLERLGNAGAFHEDLNAKNVLLAPRPFGFEALVIDVDRVRFHAPRSPMVMDANFARLERSLRKLAGLGLTVTAAEIDSLRRT